MPRDVNRSRLPGSKRKQQAPRCREGRGAPLHRLTLRRPKLLLLIPISVALAACGGGDDGEDAEAPQGARERPAERPVTTVDLDEFSIKPKRLTVSSAATIEAKNVGAIAHNLTIERGPDASKPSEELAATPTFAGGESDTVKVELEPGRYALVCTVGDHRQQGMIGSLTVR